MPIKRMAGKMPRKISKKCPICHEKSHFIKKMIMYNPLGVILKRRKYIVNSEYANISFYCCENGHYQYKAKPIKNPIWQEK